MNHHPELNNFALIHPTSQGTNGINISLKQAHKAWIYALVEQASDATRETVTLQQSSGAAGSASGTNEKALTNNVPLLVNEDTELNNVLTAGTAAKSYQFSAGTSKSKLCVFEIIPEACMDLAGGFDCIVANGSGAHGTTLVTIFAIIEPRYGPLATVFAD